MRSFLRVPSSRRPLLASSLAAALIAVAIALPVAALVQHGHAPSFEEHFDAIAERLQLTSEQRAAIEPPVRELIPVLEDFQRLHDQIAAELSEDQRHQLGQMLHEHLGMGAMGHHGGSGHADGHPH